MYDIRITTNGNPDYGQYLPPTTPVILVAETFSGLQQKIQAYQLEHDLGGGNWTNPIACKDGQPLGYVSYNLRLWVVTDKGVEVEVVVAS
tara:strand:+ start:150 stop:419 length:270 start_codon:yes stop_codon:yes gene_type:complete